MDILYLLIPLSLVLVFAIGGLFWWALQRRQFDDLDQEGQSILFDDDQVVCNAKAGDPAAQAR